jgi:hypothetical protein
VTTLALGLLQAARALSTNSEEFSGRPLRLTGAGLLALQDGRLMLELVLDGSLRVIVDVPGPALPALHECFFAMDGIRRAQVAESARATHH